jgi:hypothetical protein
MTMSVTAVSITPQWAASNTSLAWCSIGGRAQGCMFVMTGILHVVSYLVQAKKNVRRHKKMATWYKLR